MNSLRKYDVIKECRIKQLYVCIYLYYAWRDRSKTKVYQIKCKYISYYIHISVIKSFCLHDMFFHSTYFEKNIVFCQCLHGAQLMITPFELYCYKGERKYLFPFVTQTESSLIVFRVWIWWNCLRRIFLSVANVHIMSFEQGH